MATLVKDNQPPTVMAPKETAAAAASWGRAAGPGGDSNSILAAGSAVILRLFSLTGPQVNRSLVQYIFLVGVMQQTSLVV